MPAEEVAETIDAGGAAPVNRVPDPGSEPRYSWTDNEPNNTPFTAVPVGRLSSALWIGVGAPITTINTDRDTDFFVFQTGDEDSLPVLFSICWDTQPARLNLLDMFLYTVEDGELGILVKESKSADTACETLLTQDEAQRTLAANTTYLLEVRAAPRLARGMHAGVYAAQARPCTT